MENPIFPIRFIKQTDWLRLAYYIKESFLELVISKWKLFLPTNQTQTASLSAATRTYSYYIIVALKNPWNIYDQSRPKTPSRLGDNFGRSRFHLNCWFNFRHSWEPLTLLHRYCAAQCEMWSIHFTNNNLLFFLNILPYLINLCWLNKTWKTYI